MRALLIAVLCICSSLSYAQDFYSGNVFLPACERELGKGGTSHTDAYVQGICIGVLKTLVVVSKNLKPSFRFCPPNSVTLDQALRVTVAYLEARPQRLHEDFVALAAEGLAQAWPCQ
jgi:hypothetical protein